MKQRLNISPDCSNMNYLPSIKIVLPYRKNYYSKPKVIYGNSNSFKENSNNNIVNNPEEFGEFEIELAAEDYIIDGKKILKKKKEKDHTMYTSLLDQDLQCHPAFMAIDVPPPRGPLFVFGEYFMRKFYTVFDRDRLLIGLAESKELIEESEDFITTPYDDSNDGINLKNASRNLSNKNKNLRDEIKVNNNNIYISENSDSDFIKNRKYSNVNTNYDKLQNEIKSILNNNLDNNSYSNDVNENNLHLALDDIGNRKNSNEDIYNNGPIIPDSFDNDQTKNTNKSNNYVDIISNNLADKKNDSSSNHNLAYEDFLKMTSTSFLDNELNLDLI